MLVKSATQDVRAMKENVAGVVQMDIVAEKIQRQEI